jgi:hypothetical protein
LFGPARCGKSWSVRLAARPRLEPYGRPTGTRGRPIALRWRHGNLPFGRIPALRRWRCQWQECANTGHSPSTHCPLICAVACSQPAKRRYHGRRGAAVSTSSLSARAEKGGERLSQSSPSRPPGLPYALPCQLPPQRGQSALERLANKPSLLIGDRVESFDGLRRCAGVKLHRAAGAMDARRAPCQRRSVRR